MPKKIINFVGLDPIATDGATNLTVSAADDPANLVLEVVGGILRVDGSSKVRIGIGKGTALLTTFDDDTPPEVLVYDTMITEGNEEETTVSVEFSSSKTATETVTVDYATTGISATDGEAYAAQSGTVIFGPGTTLAYVDSTVNGDDTQKPEETFIITLSNPVGADIGDGQGIGSLFFWGLRVSSSGPPFFP